MYKPLNINDLRLHFVSFSRSFAMNTQASDLEPLETITNFATSVRLTEFLVRTQTFFSPMNLL